MTKIILFLLYFWIYPQLSSNCSFCIFPLCPHTTLQQFIRHKVVKTSTKRLSLRNCSVFLWIVRFFRIWPILAIWPGLSKIITFIEYQRVIAFVIFWTLLAIWPNWPFLPEKIFTILLKSVQNVHTGIPCHLAKGYIFLRSSGIWSDSNFKFQIYNQH